MGAKRNDPCFVSIALKEVSKQHGYQYLLRHWEWGPVGISMPYTVDLKYPTILCSD